MPADFGRTPTAVAPTQAALGRALLDLRRAAPEAGSRIVTVSPDVSSSTNLGGWLNKVGVWSPQERTDWFADDAETILHWRERPTGQHIELGIAEGNLVGVLGELGATWSRWGQPLLPIGVLYDPFVFLAGINRVPVACLGVSEFGQSGDIDSVYRYHGIDTGSIVAAALDLVD